MTEALPGAQETPEEVPDVEPEKPVFVVDFAPEIAQEEAPAVPTEPENGEPDGDAQEEHPDEPQTGDWA